jgi:putative endonuclease
MKYVYLLESIDHPEETDIGLTDDLKLRFAAHNAGRSPHTAKFRPWRLVTYIAFSDEQKAVDFERYLNPLLEEHSRTKDCEANPPINKNIRRRPSRPPTWCGRCERGARSRAVVTPLP